MRLPGGFYAVSARFLYRERSCFGLSEVSGFRVMVFGASGLYARPPSELWSSVSETCIPELHSPVTQAVVQPNRSRKFGLCHRMASD